MCQFASLQLYHDKAAQKAIVEHEVGKKLVVFNQYALLARHEREAFAEFEQEVGYVGYYCAFKVFS